MVAAPPSLYHKSMKKKFQNPAWYTNCGEWLKEFYEFFEHIGADNFTNATRKFDALEEEVRRKDAIIQEFVDITQTTNYGRAKVRVVSLMRGALPDELNRLPECFHRPPAVWLTGKKKTVLNEGFAPMGVRDAERKHRSILPLLVEMWDLAADDENERMEIEKAYRNWSADEFEKELYLTINKLEEPTLEDLLEEKLATREAENEIWREKNAAARAKYYSKKRTS